MKRLWLLFESLSTRLRLVLLLFLIIVPFSVLLTRSTLDRYNLLLENTQDKTLLLAQAAATNQREIIAQTRQLVETIANNPAVNHEDWKGCQKFLLAFWQQFQDRYSNFHVADVQGNVRCSGLPQAKAVNISDRQDVQDAITSRSMVMGDLVVSRTTGLLSLHARYPMTDAQGRVFAVISAQISAEQFVQAAESSSLPKHSELIIADRQNKIIVHTGANQDLHNTYLPEGPLTAALRNSADQVIQAPGIDGAIRVYAVTRTSKSSNDGLRIAVGIPLKAVVAEVRHHVIGNIFTMLLVIAIAIAFTWYGVDALVLRKVNVLIKTVRQLREGDSAARTGLVYGMDELSHVARAVDETAEELERVLKLLREQTVRDPLTGLFNRRYLSEHLSSEIQKTARTDAPIGVIMADIDHFKRINDTYGHEGGDTVLISVAQTLMENARAYDIVCRYGGEEFAIILPGANLGITLSRAEAIRRTVEGLRLKVGNTQIGPISLSLGIALFPDHGQNEHDLLRKADEALYEAKGAGRNRVMVAPTTS